MGLLLRGAGRGNSGGAPSTTGDPVQQSRNNIGSGTEIVMPGTAAEIAAGSAIVIALHTKNAGNVTDAITGGGGNVGSWTVAPGAINNSNFATNRYLTIAYARTTGVVAANTVFTIENSGAALMAAIMYSVANVHADILAAPIGTFASGTSTSPASVITPATVNDTVMAFFGVVDGTEANCAADATYSGAYEKEMTGGPVEGVVVGAWKKPGSTSAQTHTGTITSNPWGARSLVLKPA